VIAIWRRVRSDIDLYERRAGEWWDPRSPAFRSLRRTKELHVELLQSRWGDRLHGARVVDLGCGGGFLTLPLAELGADVIGIDLSPASIAAASHEASRRRIRCRLECGDLQQTGLASESAQFVVLSDVLEHLDSPASAIAEAARLLRRGGELFVATINRTLRARILAVSVAERLSLVARGTHDWRMFVRPDELVAMAAKRGLRPASLAGESPCLWATVRDWTITLRHSRSTAISYNAFFVKESP
jgi:2-polyprenyl-6-hydroxyphenyl methylase/3-demethylubiquinone-9 3-methyltransferase